MPSGALRESVRSRLPVLLVVALAAAVPLAACGGGKPPSAMTPRGEDGTTAAPDGGLVPGPHAGAGNVGTGTGTTRSITPSAMVADLQAIGLDPKALPALDKLPPEKLRQVMKTFSKALGTNCNGCHDPNDFRAPTPKKNIASRMWDLYVRGLAMEDGSALYCDSCHGGKATFLDRQDGKALGAWMDANFVSKLKRVDAKPQACETCHGDPFQPKILARWSQK